MVYLVNTPVPAAGISGDNARGSRIVRKMNSWPRSEASRVTVKFLANDAMKVTSWLMSKARRTAIYDIRYTMYEVRYTVSVFVCEAGADSVRRWVGACVQDTEILLISVTYRRRTHQFETHLSA